jgi:hypothetical protein
VGRSGEKRRNAGVLLLLLLLLLLIIATTAVSRIGQRFSALLMLCQKVLFATKIHCRKPSNKLPWRKSCTR